MWQWQQNKIAVPCDSCVTTISQYLRFTCTLVLYYIITSRKNLQLHRSICLLASISFAKAAHTIHRVHQSLQLNFKNRTNDGHRRIGLFQKSLVARPDDTAVNAFDAVSISTTYTFAINVQYLHCRPNFLMFSERRTCGVASSRFV